MSDWSKGINKSFILFYMNSHGGYGSVKTLDDFEVMDGFLNDDNPITFIYPKNGSTFIPWGLTKTYYNDVILFMLKDMRDSKLKQIGI